MQNTQGVVCSMDQLPKEIQAEVEKTTQEILGHWKRSAESIIQIGLGLDRLKTLLPGKMYSEHIRARLGMSEMQSWRLISVAKKFGDARSQKILNSKPSVLYLLASSTPTDKIEKLARGASVKVGGKSKTIDELKVGEAMSLCRKNSKREPFSKESDHTADKKRCQKAYENIGTISQDMIDWVEDIKRFISYKWIIPDREMLLDSLKECQKSVQELIRCLNA